MKDKDAYMHDHGAEFEELERIEDYRQGMTLQEQADFMQAAYQGISDENRRVYFMLLYKALQGERRKPFTVIQGGKT